MSAQGLGDGDRDTEGSALQQRRGGGGCSPRDACRRVGGLLANIKLGPNSPRTHWNVQIQLTGSRREVFKN